MNKEVNEIWSKLEEKGKKHTVQGRAWHLHKKASIIQIPTAGEFFSAVHILCYISTIEEILRAVLSNLISVRREKYIYSTTLLYCLMTRIRI